MEGGGKNLKRAAEEENLTLQEGQSLMEVVSLQGSNLIKMNRSGGQNDDMEQKIRKKKAFAFLLMWATIVGWTSTLNGIVAQYVLSLDKKKRRKRDKKRRERAHQKKKERREYVRILTGSRDSECISQLRMNISSFDLLCGIVRDRGLLQDTRQIKVEEQLAMFLHTLGHNVKNRANCVRFFRSGETVSRHFHRCLKAINTLAPEIIKPAGPHTPRGPIGFEECVGAIGGSHIPAHVPVEQQGPFRNRKGILSQNVMAACGFDLNFQYVLAGWEGSASCARVLQNALEREDRLVVPLGKYYLVDAGYANAPGFLAPYRGVRYHPSEYGDGNPQNEKELFNKLHSQACNAIERAFGILKMRFPILKIAPQYSIPAQVAIVSACCVLHNFIRENGGHEFDEDPIEQDPNVDEEMDDSEEDDMDVEDMRVVVVPETPQTSSQREREEWKIFRDQLAMSMWIEYNGNGAAH